MRPVRLAEAAVDDINEQLDAEAAELFRRYDLATVLEALSRPDLWDDLPEAGAGRRLTVNGMTVAGFHTFVAEDRFDPRPEALVVYSISIWQSAWPEEPTLG